jgi:membrane protein
MSAKSRRTGLLGVIKASATDFSRDHCGLRAAALSYYTAFALPPLLIVLIKLAGLVWDPASVRHALESQFGGLVGSAGATQVSQMVSRGEGASESTVAALVGVGGLLLGATGAFLSLQDALNAVWHVKPDPKQGGVKRFITKRLLSLGMLMGLAFLLVVSLAISAMLAALGGVLGGSGVVMQIVNIVMSIAFLSVLFTAMFKFLPDATIAWRSVLVGGAATAVLFEVGKFGIGLYLGRSNPGNAFGAASAFAVILVWIYYAGMLVLLGAEFTRNWAGAHGYEARPKHGAVPLERDERIVRDGMLSRDVAE